MKNEYKVTKDLIKSWAKEYHLHGSANVCLFVLWVIVGLLGVFGVILSIILQSTWTHTYICSLMIILAVFKLFIARFFAWAQKYKILSTTYGVAEWIRTTEFLDDEIVLTDHTSVSRFKYGNIKGIKEKNNAVLIFMNDNMGLRLYKDAFVSGSWEECKALISEKKNSAAQEHA